MKVPKAIQRWLLAPFLYNARRVRIIVPPGLQNPARLTGADLDKTPRMLTEEATGTLPAGIYYDLEDDV